MMRLQLADAMLPADMEFLNNLKGYTQKLSFIAACQLVRNDSDLPVIITGTPGFGKGTLAIRIAKLTTKYLRTYFMLADKVPKFRLKENIIYNPSKKDFNELLSLNEYNIKVIDEAYLTGTNLESSTEKAVFTGKVVNITRSKHNLLLFCSQNITRTTKFLMEAFYVWIHIYVRGTEDKKVAADISISGKPGRAALLVRTKLFTPRDEWGIDKLLKATTERQIVSRFRANKNLAFFFRTKPLPSQYFKKYQAIKHQEQDKWKALNGAKDIMKETRLQYAMELEKAVNAKVVNADVDSDLEMYIRKKYSKYNFSRPQIKGIIKTYREYQFAVMSNTLRE